MSTTFAKRTWQVCQRQTLDACPYKYIISYVVGEGFQLRSKFAKANIAASRVVLNKYFLIHAFSLSRFATAPSRREPEFECLLDKPRPRGEVAALADGEGILPPPSHGRVARGLLIHHFVVPSMFAYGKLDT